MRGLNAEPVGVASGAASGNRASQFVAQPSSGDRYRSQAGQSLAKDMAPGYDVRQTPARARAPYGGDTSRLHGRRRPPVWMAKWFRAGVTVESGRTGSHTRRPERGA